VRYPKLGLDHICCEKWNKKNWKFKLFLAPACDRDIFRIELKAHYTADAEVASD